MGSTLLALRTDVKLLINSDDFFTDATLDVHINASFKMHHGIVSDALQNILALDDFIDVVEGTRDYALSTVKTSGRTPAQIINVKYLADNSSSVEYYDLSYETQTNTNDISTKSVPGTYEVIGSNIVLGTIPSETLTNGLKVRFVPDPEDLSSDSSTVDDIFNGSGDNCIVYYAVMLAKIQEETWDPGSAAGNAFRGIYEDFVRRFKNNLEMRVFEEDEIRSYPDDFEYY